MPPDGGGKANVCGLRSIDGHAVVLRGEPRAGPTYRTVCVVCWVERYGRRQRLWGPGIAGACTWSGVGAKYTERVGADYWMRVKEEWYKREWRDTPGMSSGGGFVLADLCTMAREELQINMTIRHLFGILYNEMYGSGRLSSRMGPKYELACMRSDQVLFTGTEQMLDCQDNGLVRTQVCER